MLAFFFSLIAFLFSSLQKFQMNKYSWNDGFVQDSYFTVETVVSLESFWLNFASNIWGLRGDWIFYLASEISSLERNFLFGISPLEGNFLFEISPLEGNFLFLLFVVVDGGPFSPFSGAAIFTASSSFPVLVSPGCCWKSSPMSTSTWLLLCFGACSTCSNGSEGVWFGIELLIFFNCRKPIKEKLTTVEEQGKTKRNLKSFKITELNSTRPQLNSHHLVKFAELWGWTGHGQNCFMPFQMQILRHDLLHSDGAFGKLDEWSKSNLRMLGRGPYIYIY